VNDPDSDVDLQMKPAPRADRRGLLAVALATVVWGSAGVMVKSSSLSGLRFAMIRLWIGAAIYGIVLLALRRRVSWSTLRACAPGGVLFGIDVSLAFLAFKGTTITNASIIGALSPIAIVLASAPLLGERIGRRELALAGVSFAGVALVAVGSAGAPTWSPRGDLYALAGVVSWAGYWFFSRRARATAGAVEYMACVMLTAAVVVTPVSLALGGSWQAPSSSDWVALVAVAIFPGFVGHTSMAWSHRHVESWLSALVTQCSPVVAAAAAWLFLEERVTLLTAVGVAVVLGATCLVIWDERRRTLAQIDVADHPS
jgi:drug/metabolite transporter (DMT)-like permease